MYQTKSHQYDQKKIFDGKALLVHHSGIAYRPPTERESLEVAKVDHNAQTQSVNPCIHADRYR